MSFLDKAKEQAAELASKAQKGLSDVQNHRESEKLLKDLGRAFYAEQRTEGSREDVAAALAAIDAFVARGGRVETKKEADDKESTEDKPAE